MLHWNLWRRSAGGGPRTGGINPERADKDKGKDEGPKGPAGLPQRQVAEVPETVLAAGAGARHRRLEIQGAVAFHRHGKSFHPAGNRQRLRGTSD